LSDPQTLRAPEHPAAAPGFVAPLIHSCILDFLLMISASATSRFSHVLFKAADIFMFFHLYGIVADRSIDLVHLLNLLMFDMRKRLSPTPH
jgi:hypothetical protein